MAFVHDKWERNGRLWRNDQNLNQFKWGGTTADDENVSLGNGQYAPFVWNARQRLLKHGRMELRFLPDRQQIAFEGKTLVTSQKFHLDVEVAPGVWQQVRTLGLPFISVDELDDHAVASLTWNVEHPQNPTSLQWVTKYSVGNHGNTGFMSHELTSPIALTTRLRSSLDGLDDRKSASDAKMQDKQRGEITIGRDQGALAWRWDKRNELDDHQARKVSGTEMEVTIDVGQLKPGETKVVSPDTYGPVEITVNTDDGVDDGASSSTWNNSTDSDGFGIFDNNQGGTRFTGLPSNIESASSIDAGTEIEYDSNFSAGAVTVDIHGIEDGTPPTFSNSYIPSDQTQTTAFGTINQGDSPGQGQIVDMESTVQELSDDGFLTNSGEVSFAWHMETASASCYVEDSSTLSGSDEAPQLTIVFTVTAVTPQLRNHSFRVYDKAA